MLAGVNRKAWLDGKFANSITEGWRGPFVGFGLPTSFWLGDGRFDAFQIRDANKSGWSVLGVVCSWGADQKGWTWEV
jgi:hypothetical protein